MALGLSVVSRPGLPKDVPSHGMDACSQKKTSLRKNEEYKSRIELIQDLDFEVASNRMKFSKDGKYLAAVGMYPPQVLLSPHCLASAASPGGCSGADARSCWSSLQVKVYDLEQLSMKFERHMDCEVIQFEILSEDYSKMAFLQSDRTIEFHAKFGTYYKTRIPKVGRDMIYEPTSCDLFVVGSSNEAYRLSLEQGRFLKPYTLAADACNCVDRSTVHGLMAFGTDAGIVECWDTRINKRVGMTVRNTILKSHANDLRVGCHDGDHDDFKTKYCSPSWPVSLDFARVSLERDVENGKPISAKDSLGVTSD